ncbi:tyrosine-type recombinase/integrase [Spirosoma sp. KCTC 42546]|uniref:site-specific integrase n=1 Tax=Spirosoma sp. KCTC 42546 TaxID=2520506 RepID=UPI0011572B27|nr:site-specific integrase [Spirosoma sp. KCTC 42546]QDK80890.1 tyrosine-type recombinase/integrase [Spirosoma sp. KCTC 42546]
MNATYKFEINSKPGKDGRYTIFLRVTANRKLRRIKTIVAVLPTEFDPHAARGKWISSKNSDFKFFNGELLKLIRKTEAEIDKLGEKGPITSEGLIDRLRNPFPDTGWTIGSFSDKMVADAASHSVGYQRNLKSRLGMFVEFAGKEVPLSSINLDLLNRFKRHLQATGKMNGTQHTYFNRIKRMTSEALKLELIAKDPFLHFDMPGDKPAPRLKLTDAQVDAIEAVDVGSNRRDSTGRTYEAGIWLFRAKWLYLFAYQMGGIRSRDVLQLRWSNIVGEPGSERLEYQMSKTGEFMSTRLTRKAREIVELFRRDGVGPDSYLFGVLSDEAGYAPYATHEQKKKMPREMAVRLFNDISSAQSQINGELKLLAKKAGITDRLTFHTARHSFADKARRKMKESKNISIDDIRQALGHQRLDTTQRYLNSFDKESLDTAMDAIFGDE